MREAVCCGVMEHHALTDRELVRLAQEGSSEAFGELVLRYQNRIYRLARRMTETQEDAEDIIQEAFVRAFKSINDFRAKSKFSTWLYRITVNLVLMKKRAKKITLTYLDEPIDTKDGEIRRDIVDTGPDPLAALIVKESRNILDRAITTLSPVNRAVFVLRHVEGMSTAETKDILNLSLPAVKSRLHRTRQTLQENLLRSAQEETRAECVV
jgi:RNA polymerase sigma-70 factor (ECF subfamily)